MFTTIHSFIHFFIFSFANLFVLLLYFLLGFFSIQTVSNTRSLSAVASHVFFSQEIGPACMIAQWLSSPSFEEHEEKTHTHTLGGETSNIFLFRGLMFKCPSSGNPCQSDYYPVLLARWSNFTSIFFIFQMGWFNHNHQRTHNFGGRKSMPLKICSPKAVPKRFGKTFLNIHGLFFFGGLEKDHFGKTPNKNFIGLELVVCCLLVSLRMLP